MPRRPLGTGRLTQRLVREVVRQLSERATRPAEARRRPRTRSRRRVEPTGATSYAPQDDGRPDPGEVVWAWVPYEDDPRQGKDRPVLVVGRREGGRLLGLQLTSKDHDRDAADEARYGRHWMDVGTGAWDRQGRPSEVRLDRLLVLEESAVRREGAALRRDLYEAVLAAARPHLP